MRRDGFHYGWAITLACGIMLFANLGLTANCLSLFITPFIETTGLSRTRGSTITGFQSLGSILTMLACGPLFKRFGARKVSLAAGLVIASGFASFAFASGMWTGCFAAFLTGVGFGAGSMVPVAILITAWFDARRGFALGLASAGSGIGTIVFPPVLAGVIARHGVAAGFLCNAAAIAALAVFAFLIIRDAPADIGAEPYGGEKKASGENSPRGGADVAFSRAIRTREFYLMGAVQILLGVTVTATMQHFSAFFTSEGHSPDFAAFMLSISGLVMLFSKPLYGWVSDRFGIAASNVYILSVWLTAMIAGMFVNVNAAFAAVFTVLFGFGMPVSSVGLPIWSGAIFGKTDMAGLFSALRLFYALGGVLGMVLPGLFADVTGRYVNVFFLYMAITILAHHILGRLFPLGGNRERPPDAECFPRSPKGFGP